MDVGKGPDNKELIKALIKGLGFLMGQLKKVLKGEKI